MIKSRIIWKSIQYIELATLSLLLEILSEGRSNYFFVIMLIPQSLVDQGPEYLIIPLEQADLFASVVKNFELHFIVTQVKGHVLFEDFL